MSSPFSKVQFVSQPVWIDIENPLAGLFAPFPQIINIDEIGFGEGGFGIDGFDAPAIHINPAPQPNWTVYTLK